MVVSKATSTPIHKNEFCRTKVALKENASTTMITWFFCTSKKKTNQKYPLQYLTMYCKWGIPFVPWSTCQISCVSQNAGTVKIAFDALLFFKFYLNFPNSLWDVQRGKGSLSAHTELNLGTLCSIWKGKNNLMSLFLSVSMLILKHFYVTQS